MNQAQPIKFSVIIPTYNREKFIVNTLESVLAQTYQHYEVIIVDNCSTDNTREVLAPYIAAGKIRFIQHERNFERARSRNTGMEAASGDFATFLDSDDFMYPPNLADAAEFAAQNPEFKFFHNLYELIDEDGRVLRSYNFPSLKNQIEAIVSGNFMSCIGNFIHREIYQNPKYRFDLYAPLTGAEDWEFWLRVAADYKLGRIEKINSGILHHAQRTVNTQSFAVLEDGNRHLIDKFASDPHLSQVYGKYLRRIQANSYMYLATLANTGGFFADARKYLKIARRKDSSITFSTRFLNTYRRAALRLQIK